MIMIVLTDIDAIHRCHHSHLNLFHNHKKGEREKGNDQQAVIVILIALLKIFLKYLIVF